MCTPFACSDYYETSASPRTFSRRRAYPTGPNGFQAKGTVRDGSRVHCEPIDQRGIQLCPGNLAASTPQSFLAASPPASQTGYRVNQPFAVGCALHPGPYPPDLSRCHDYGTLSLVSFVYRLISLAGPGLSGSATPSRLCQRCLPSSPASPESDCAQLLSSCCDSSTRRSCTSFGSQRLTAHSDSVAQHQKFDVLRHRRAAQQHQQIEKVEKHQVADATPQRTITPRELTTQSPGHVA